MGVAFGTDLNARRYCPGAREDNRPARRRA